MSRKWTSTTIMTQPNPEFERGDVVLVFFPNSDLRSAKLRPCLIVQANKLQTGLKQRIVAMVTSNLLRSGHPSRFLIPLASPEGRRSGLLTDSVVMTDNLATISENEISRTIGNIPMNEVDLALAHTLAL